jgi:hypothetical protein
MTARTSRSSRMRQMTLRWVLYGYATHYVLRLVVFQGLMKGVSELTKYRRRTAIRRLTQAPSPEATTRVRREPHGQAATAATKRTRTRLVGALPRLSLRPSHCPRKSCTWEMGRGREIDKSRALTLLQVYWVEGFGRVSLSGHCVLCSEWS